MTLSGLVAEDEERFVAAVKYLAGKKGEQKDEYGLAELGIGSARPLVGKQ